MLCIEQKNSLKGVQQDNEFKNGIKKYICTLFMNTKNSKTSDRHRLLLNLTDKID